MGPHFGNFTGPTTGPGVGSAAAGPDTVAATETVSGAQGSDQTLHVPGGGVIENAADDTDNYGRGYGAGGYGAGASETRRAEQAMGVGTGYYHGVGNTARAGVGAEGGPGAIPGAGYGSGTGAGLGTAGATGATGAAADRGVGAGNVGHAAGKASVSDRIVGALPSQDDVGYLANWNSVRLGSVQKAAGAVTGNETLAARGEARKVRAWHLQLPISILTSDLTLF